jgi:hypothetical protein|eukprot:COSAG01_NODE_1934_length_8866_cov_17.762633_4_plen_71_part_00
MASAQSSSMPSTVMRSVRSVSASAWEATLPCGCTTPPKTTRWAVFPCAHLSPRGVCTCIVNVRDTQISKQ